MRCAVHPGVETNLTCGRCGTPICPKCLVQTPVGSRCLKCANPRRLPVYEINLAQYLKAVGAALGLAVAVGCVWALFWEFMPFFFMNILLAVGVGYFMGEVVSLSVNRRRGRGLLAIGVFGVILSYLVAVFLPWGISFSAYNFLVGLLILATGIIVVASRLR